MGMIGNMFLRFRRRPHPQPPLVFSHKGTNPKPELRTGYGIERLGTSASGEEIRAEAELKRHTAEKHHWPKQQRKSR